jgi:hypothetical protein
VGACVSRAILESGGDVAIFDNVETPELETWSMYYVSQCFQLHRTGLKLPIVRTSGSLQS